jgi:hypothetical protein
VALLGLCLAAIAAMLIERSFDDPAAILWTAMLAVQCMPYLATVACAWISARSYGRRDGAAALRPPQEPALPKAA